MGGTISGAGPAGPSDEDGSEGPPGRSSRIGLTFFALYLAVYTGFVALNVFAPATLESTPVAGVNVATLYGMALIAGAFALALVYAWLLRERRT